MSGIKLPVAVVRIAGRGQGYWLMDADDKILRHSFDDALLEAEAKRLNEGDPLTFPALARACVDRNIEWHGETQPSLLFRATELGGATLRATKVVRKLAREREGWPGSRATVDDLADELADVVICTMHVANCEGIDLGAAIVRKFNATSQKLNLKTMLPAPPEGGAV